MKSLKKTIIGLALLGFTLLPVTNINSALATYHLKFVEYKLKPDGHIYKCLWCQNEVVTNATCTTLWDWIEVQID